MQHPPELPARSIPQASAAAKVKGPGSRLAYIDMARVILICGVVMIHAAATYGAVGEWTFKDPNARDLFSGVLLTVLVICGQSFAMGLFFFIAGYFTAPSFDRKGVVSFWKSRLIHLAVPMALYTWIFSRWPNYLDAVVNEGETASFWRYSLRTFWRQADEGPTWFLFVLLAFSAGYTLIRIGARWSKRDEQVSSKRVAPPTTPALIIVAVALAAAMFLIAQFINIIEQVDILVVFSLLPAFFPAYVLLFGAGILAYRYDWLARLPSKMNRFWGPLSVGWVVLLPVFLIVSGAIKLGTDPYVRGSNWRCALFCLWLGTAGIAFSVSLTLRLRDRIAPGNRLAQWAGPNSYAVYIIHPLVLVPVCVWLSQFLIHPLLKFVTASALTIPVCFVLAEGLRRIPGVKKIL